MTPVPSADPYRHFRFKVRWDDRVVAGVSRMTAPRPPTAVVRGAPPAAPPAVFAPITLELGVTYDAAFAAWAAARSWPAEGVELRKDLVIEMSDESGQPVLQIHATRCWASAFVALPDLDAVAIESMTLENDGWSQVLVDAAAAGDRGAPPGP